MTVSAIRTIVVSPPPSAYGVLMAAPTLRWPVAQPDDVLDYSLDLTAMLDDVSDFISSAQVSIAPSGAGELQVSNVTATGAAILTAWLSGGVAGRDYLIKVEVTTRAARVFEFLVALGISSTLAVSPLPTPPNAGFGTPVNMPTTVASQALANSEIFKSAAGVLFSVNLNAIVSGWFMLFDATAAPADGVVTPLKAWAFNAADNQSLNLTFSPALILQNGITVAFSTTGPFTKTTPSAVSAQFSGEIA